MTHRIQAAFRHILPALLLLFLLLLPAIVFPFATSQAPATVDPTTAPPTFSVRVSDQQRTLGDEDPASITWSRSTGAAAASGPVKITATPAPFLTVASGDQIVREFIVQNDSAKPIDVTFVMNYMIGWHGNRINRSVTTSRKIPAKTIQTVFLYVPSCLQDEGTNMEVYDPRIYVDGRPFKPLPPGIFDIGNQSWDYYTAPSSFSDEEAVLNPLVDGIVTKLFKSYGWRKMEAGFSNSDTVQWPAIPQFYQAKDLIIRKTTDQFTPDAERAIREAVMLGATEMLFVPEGSRAPDWAPEPFFSGVPVIVPRGFGRSIVIDERVFASLPGVPRQNTMANGMPDPDDVDEWKSTGTRPNSGQEKMIAGMIQPLIDYIKNADLFIANPAVVCQMLPCVDVPNMSFAVVILALLAYIVIVGPVNYFYLIRHRKSILLLLLTVPVISFLFVAVVIVFVTLFEGWYTRASAVGMTFLDQQESMAYTRAAVSLYAPLPVRRLTFDPADTVSFARARDANVSLGRDQVVTGANKARVPLVYGISRAEKHLEQLKISRSAAGTLTVMNGLGAPVKILAMKTPDGQLWLSPDDTVRPGASVELKPYTGSEAPGSSLDERLEQDTWTQEKPKTGNSISLKSVRFNDVASEKVDPKTGKSFPLGRNQLFCTVCAYLLEPGGKGAGNNARSVVPADWNGFKIFSAGSSMGQCHDALLAAQAEDAVSPLAACLAPGMYVAETDRPLFYTPGCSPLSFRARHLVVGTFNLQE